jgi:MFS family permease
LTVIPGENTIKISDLKQGWARGLLGTPTALPKQKLYYGYIIVIASTLILVGALGIHYAFGVFFKPLLADFGWSRAVTSGAVSLSWIVQGFASIALGALNDKLGPRLVLCLGGIILAAGYLLMSQVNSLWQLYLFYGVLVGGGLGGVYVPLVSTVVKWFVVRRSAMTGIVVSGIGIGTLIAPLVANWLISAYDWRIAYKILGAAVLIIVLSAAQVLKRAPIKDQMPLSERSESITVSEGISYKDAIRTRQFWMVFSLFLCFGICLYVVLVHIVPFATDLNINSISAAGVLSAIGGVSILGKVIFGKVGDRIGNRGVYIICFVIMIISMLLLAVSGSIWMLYIFAIIFGFAYAGCAAAQSPLVAYMFGLRAHGIILGSLNSGFTLGAAIGPFMAGYIFDTTDSYAWAFVISAAIAGAGLIITISLKPAQKS